MYMTPNERLREMRIRHGLRQAEVAELLNTTQRQISKYERGLQVMGTDKYIILAKHYNVSLDYLTGLIDTPRKLH